MRLHWLVAGSLALCGAIVGVAVANRGTAADKADFKDPQILEVADVANTGEVEQANVALGRTQSDPVKSFAELMVKDHTAAKGQSIAKELGVTMTPSALSTDLKRDGDSLMTSLKDADPASFDRTYMQAQVSEHEKVLKLLDDKLIPKASAPQVKGLLGDMRHHVEHHLMVARGTLDKLGQ